MKSLTMIARVCVVCACAVSTASCAWLEQQTGYEIHATGGIVGHYADYALPAPNKEMIVYRAAVVVAIFSRIAASSKHEDADANAIYFSMKAAVTDMNELLGHLKADSVTPAKVPCAVADAGHENDNCPTSNYAETFESDLPALEGALFRFVTSSVPRGSADKVVGAATSGDYLGAALDVAQTAGELLLAAHDAASVYRSEEEVYAAMLRANNTANTLSCNVSDTYTPNTVVEAVAYIQKFDKCIATVPVPGNPNFVVPKRAYDALFSLIRSSCVTILQPVPSTSRPAGSAAGISACEDLKYAPIADRKDYLGQFPP